MHITQTAILQLQTIGAEPQQGLPPVRRELAQSWQESLQRVRIFEHLAPDLWHEGVLRPLAFAVIGRAPVVRLVYALQHLRSLVWKQAQGALEILFPAIRAEGDADVAAEGCVCFIVDLLADQIKVAQVSFGLNAVVVGAVVDGLNAHVVYTPWRAVFEVVAEDEFTDVVREGEEIKSVVALLWTRLKRVEVGDRLMQSTMHVKIGLQKRMKVSFPA